MTGYWGEGRHVYTRAHIDDRLLGDKRTWI